MNMPRREDELIRIQVQRALQIIARRLEDYAGGDDAAFESLSDELAEAGFGPEELRTAVAVLDHWAEEPTVVACEESPGKAALRVLSAEERESVTPEAWGFLIALRERGSLDAQQFEQVLDRLVMSGLRPAGVDLAREVAAQVVLDSDGQGDARHETGSGH